ncbi:AIPR family protein [Actinomadura sp. DC4]|uniref:AIPR family protein n=1 Tax=Actinomadura sp. DC4 TaxID=3055069 RepID=UPI0025B24585|nr:AIPR family protein [Actinomadura sp. DC4]MDN3357625.1 AIPR family protein [Actinomadura sp. DC4]
MKKLWVRHIREAIKTGFSDHIDLHDYANANESVREKAFLSRGLAALAVQRFTGLTPKDAASTVVDGTGDNGIDAIAVDEDQQLVILVQSKWDGSGNGGLGLGDARNFIAGFRDLLNLKYDRFTAALRRQQEQITAALDNPDIRFMLIVAITGQTDLAKPVQDAFDDELAEINETQPLATLEVLGLNEFHALISEGLDGSRIDLDVTLENWGTIGEPYEAYYGVVAATDVSDWYERHGDRLFSQNIRKALGRTSVNETLDDTLVEDPGHFWYFNNGITALCESIKKTARGATSRTYGAFSLSGVSVVNGAQTVAAVHRAAHRSAESVGEARVWVRFISLEGCPPDFGTAVTRATNTQNTVEARDFVALDPEQNRLRTELVLSLRKTYSIKRGEQTPRPEDGCTVVDATIALACANREPQLAVLAKSKVGSLWESIEKPPYRLLFNSGIGAYRVWRCVQVMRSVDAELVRLQRHMDGRSRSIAAQGNRLVLHLVFRGLDLHRIDDPELEWADELTKVEKLTGRVVEALIDEVEARYSTNYVTSLFKNITKCRDLAAGVRAALEVE